MRNSKSLKMLACVAAVGLTVISCDKDDDNEVVQSTPKRVYASNNADGNITYYDVSDMSNVSTTTLITTSVAADGIYFDNDADLLVQASRSGLGLEGYTNTSILPTGSSISVNVVGSTDMTSPREVAVNGNFFVVADNADADGDPLTLDGRLFVYERTNGQFELRNTLTTDFKLWGITFIGGDLYAVVDADNELAVFTNFLNNSSDASISATKRVEIEGITRTHGLTYDVSTGTMIMTDIGLATNPQDDGALHIISDFMTKFNAVSNGGILALSQQVRVSGSNTLLGNPVDVAYDGATQTIFVAEAGNSGGRILAFSNIGTGGNLTPALNNSLASASSVYLSK